MPTVIIFGAGIAGLTTAHYLSRHGKYNVTVIEALPIPGGLARSERIPEDKGVPSEYSWRGFGPWYHNTFRMMKEIVVVGGSVYDQNLSHPIRFHLAGNSLDSTRGRSGWRLNRWELLKVVWLLLRQWTACASRSARVYAKQNALATLRRWVRPLTAETIGSVFGPFVGSDASRASVHHVADFFKKNTFPGTKHVHPPAHGRPGFIHGGCADGWLILNRPSNEAWFDPWVTFLQKERGVRFVFNTALHRLAVDGANITHAEMLDGTVYAADIFVLAINPFSARDVLVRSTTNALARQFDLLTAQPPHMQISFQIVFDEDIRLPGHRETAVVLTDSEFDITFFAQSQLFLSDVSFGGAGAVWSGTATNDATLGAIYGKSILFLTKEEFIAEVRHQILRSQTLNTMVRQANQNRDLTSFAIRIIQVWHGWDFATSLRPTNANEFKWVNTTRNKAFEPETRTFSPHLFLAGAHTQTSADLYSMEAAVESGVRAANAIMAHQTPVLLQSNPFKWIKRIDRLLDRVRLPHILDVIMAGLTVRLIFTSVNFFVK